MRHWKDLTKLYKFTSNKHCEIWIPSVIERTKKRMRESQRRLKLHLAFERLLHEETSVRMLGKEIKNLHWVIERHKWE